MTHHPLPAYYFGWLRWDGELEWYKIGRTCISCRENDRKQDELFCTYYCEDLWYLRRLDQPRPTPTRTYWEQYWAKRAA